MTLSACHAGVALALVVNAVRLSHRKGVGSVARLLCLGFFLRFRYSGFKKVEEHAARGPGQIIVDTLVSYLTRRDYQ